MDELIRKKREQYLSRRKVYPDSSYDTQEEEDKKDEGSEDEEHDLEAEGEAEDVIRTVKSVNKKSSNVPSREEFFEESKPAKEVTIRSFNQLRLSRPLLRAINEMGFTTPSPIQVVASSQVYLRLVASHWHQQEKIFVLQLRLEVEKLQPIYFLFSNGYCISSPHESFLGIKTIPETLFEY